MIFFIWVFQKYFCLLKVSEEMALPRFGVFHLGTCSSQQHFFVGAAHPSGDTCTRQRRPRPCGGHSEVPAPVGSGGQVAWVHECSAGPVACGLRDVPAAPPAAKNLEAPGLRAQRALSFGWGVRGTAVVFGPNRQTGYLHFRLSQPWPLPAPSSSTQRPTS